MDNTEYFMEHEKENWRLANKVDPDVFVERYVSPVVRPGMEILDLGCGPGVIAAAIARQHPESHVVGMDNSAVKLKEVREEAARWENLSVKEGDAYNIPYGNNRFDFVYTRFLLQYMRYPEKIVKEMMRVCRPGGILWLQDLDGQFQWHYPEDRKLQKRITRVFSLLRKRTGFDPHIGRKLYYLLHSQGCRDIQTEVERYHLLAGRVDEKNLKLWELKLDIALSNLKGSLKSLGGAGMKKDILEYFKREDTLTYSVVFTTYGRKP